MFISPPIAKFSLGLGLAVAFIHPAFSQITPNGAGTVVNPQGNQINISGGTQAGANLFHSFQDFNVNSGQVANFLSNPQTQNILGRINGGNPSFINGLLQVTGGNSNLFLMNPAGIIFGQGASLNVPASFTATTANQIGFGNNLFNAFGDNNFSALIGNPDSFIFSTTQAGSIVNAGNLAVGSGQNLSLIGGNTINTGRLTAPGGEIQLLAVPGTNRVRLSQPGQVLSLEIVPPVDGVLRAVDLPALLTGRDLPGIQVNPSGQVQIAGTTLPNQQGVAVASGRIDVSSATGNGGVVQVMGDRVAVLNSRIIANGATGGGIVRLGGEYLGGRDTGIAPAFRFNSQRTVVDANSLIRANATTTGEGGRVIVWADQGTGFFGRITGRGATGRGGFVEVSGRESLAFDGKVDLSGANGLFGNLLLDPTNITFIFPGIGTGDALAAGGIIGVGALPANMTISFGAISGIPVATTVDIRASGNIDFAMPLLGIINFSGPGAPISFTASTITASAGVNLVSSGRNVTIVADSINASNLSLNTTTATAGGSLQVTANTGNLILGTLTTAPPTSGNGGAISLNAPNGNITVNSINSQGTLGGNTSGAINLVAGNLVQVTGTTACLVGISICSVGQGGAGDGAITINHDGGITTPFTVGNSATNGTAGAIDAGPSGNVSTVIGAIPIPPNTFDSYTYNVGVINIITNLPPAPPIVEPSVPPEVLTLLRNPPPPPTPDPVIVGTPPEPEPIPILELPTPSPSPSPVVTPITIPSPEPSFIPIAIPSPIPSPVLGFSLDLPRSLRDILLRTANPLNTLPTLPAPPGSIPIITIPAIDDILARLGSLENYFQLDFAQYLGRTPPALEGSYRLAVVQERLNEITAATGVKPALIYVFFAPQDGTNNFSSLGLNAQSLETQTDRPNRDNDPLEVILVTGKTAPLRVQLPGTTRRQVLAVAHNFRSEVTNFRSPRGYLDHAQQMYKWLITPLKAELQKQGINNLIFLMDTGLRSTPLAAMHDGKGFILEDYSLGLMPGFNLTDSNYYALEGSQVLAMGATTFGNSGLNPLPAVSLELDAIERLWRGAKFLNETFTLHNLIQQRQNRPFRMIHLATHAVFSPGVRSNSYIQLWDQRLGLDQINELNWGNPPVDLLVLSACQTALGDRGAELGFAGLMVQSGVRSTLASLWEVNDVATLGLMTKFYQQLQVTTTKAEALRQAQLALLRGEVRLENGNLVTPNGSWLLSEEVRNLSNLNLTHPYYWSAFTMVGNPW